MRSLEAQALPVLPYLKEHGPQLKPSTVAKQKALRLSLHVSIALAGHGRELRLLAAAARAEHHDVGYQSLLVDEAQHQPTPPIWGMISAARG